MANLETQILDEVIVKSRRKMLSLGGAALAGLAVAGVTQANAQTAALTDNDILNFALNLEYLEAQYYNLAVSGVTIDKLSTPIPISVNGGTGGTVALKPNFAKVPFTDTAIAAYAAETAIEEGKHVTFLQTALSTAAVSMPNIDLYTSFNTLAAAAGIGPAFDPFASDATFLIGAYIFEDVGVTAYHGAAGSITTKSTLTAAVGIHAVEAYHAGLVRLSINRLDAGSGTLLGYTQKISATRSALANPGGKPLAQDDYGIMNTTVALQGTAATYPVTTLVDVDISESSAATSYSQGFARTPQQVLQIVTGGGAGNKGVFYPAGLNGTIK
jgi:Ferritin-like domain